MGVAGTAIGVACACALAYVFVPSAVMTIVMGGFLAMVVVASGAVRGVARQLGEEELANELSPELMRALVEPTVVQMPTPEAPAALAPPAVLGGCPRCATALEEPGGAYDERRCPRTCGSLLPLTGSERLFEHASLDGEIVRAVVREQGMKKGACASCGAAMHEGRLRGVTVDLCLSCGALWLDQGELEKIAHARAFAVPS